MRTETGSRGRHLRRTALPAVLGIALGLLGCGKSAQHHTSTVIPGDDAGTSSDAGTDAATSAADGGGGSDAGKLHDSGIPAADGGKDDDGGGASEACSVADTDDEVDGALATGTTGSFALSIGLTGFGLAYHARGCGLIETMPIAAEGAFAQPSMLLGDCFSVDDIALVHVTDGWRIAWVDNSAGSAELQTMLIGNDLTMSDSAARARLTTNSLREHTPVFATIAGVPHLVWIGENLDTGAREVDHKRFDGTDQPDTLFGMDSQRKPVALALAQMATSNGALAFVDEQGMPGIWLQALDKTFKPSGNPVLVSSAITAGNSVDLATREEDGGAIVYAVDIGGVNKEIRFRRLDKNGAFLGPEVELIGSPFQARDASIARLGGGYVIAYRQLATSASPKNEIRMIFITKEGNVMNDSVGRLLSYHVADTTSDGGSVIGRVSTDGQYSVAFVDNAPDGNQVRLVRRRLDCAL